jgi:hypothetical protein
MGEFGERSPSGDEGGALSTLEQAVKETTRTKRGRRRKISTLDTLEKRLEDCVNHP